MNAAIDRFVDKTYSLNTLAREFTSLDGNSSVDKSLRFYRELNTNRAIAVSPSQRKGNRFDIVVDIYLDDNNKEVLLGNSLYMSICDEVEAELKFKFYNMIRKNDVLTLCC